MYGFNWMPWTIIHTPTSRKREILRNEQAALAERRRLRGDGATLSVSRY